MRRVIINALKVLGLLLLVTMVAPALLLIPGYLLLGWIPSLTRLVAAWHPETGSVVLFCLAVLAMIGGSHAFARWLHASLKRPSEPPAPPAHWRLSWTLSGFGMAFCALTAIIALVLTVHQLYWLRKSSDPWFASVYGKRHILIPVAKELMEEAKTRHWKCDETRAAFGRIKGGREPAIESFQPIWVDSASNTVRAVLLVPRRPPARSHAWFGVVSPDGITTRPWSELPEALASYGIADPSLKAEATGGLLP